MSTPETGGGLLLVHAHPDDESIETGATMARYAAAGVPVTLVTCTLGELGEIIPADLAYLAAGRVTCSASTGSGNSRPPAPRSASPITASSAARAAGATPA